MHGYAIQHPSYQSAIKWIAEDLDNYVILLAFLVFFFLVFRSIEKHKKNKFFLLLQEGIIIFASVVLSWAVSYFIKISSHMPRPFLRFPNEVKNLFPYGGYDSFPSGHATLFMAVATVMYLYNKKIGLLFIFFAVLISFARVIAGVHFPIDILVGWMIAMIVSYGTYYAMRKFLNPFGKSSNFPKK